MKNVLILHGTQATSKSNWFSWLKEELDKKGFKTWLPDLPNPNLPSLTGINKFILSNKDWEFNSDSIIV
jgi:predicted alpha/beta hydrolase family esterase